MRSRLLGGAVLLVLLTACSTNVEVAVGELPAPVQTAINERFPGAEYLEADRLEDRKGTKYDVEIRHQGKRYEVEVREDGTIVDVDRDFA